MDFPNEFVGARGHVPLLRPLAWASKDRNGFRSAQEMEGELSFAKSTKTIFKRQRRGMSIAQGNTLGK